MLDSVQKLLDSFTVLVKSPNAIGVLALLCLLIALLKDFALTVL